MNERAVVLLVDDRKNDRELTEVVLRERLPGARLLVAINALSLGELLVAEKCHAAVIEADLHWCPAPELVTRLRRRNPECLIIFYSREGIRTLTPDIADLALTAFYPKEADSLLAIPQVLEGRMNPAPAAPGETSETSEAPKTPEIPEIPETPETTGRPGPAVRSDGDTLPDSAFQSEMFQAISHDLKQPLQIFNRQVKLLDRKYKDQLDSAGKGLIENMSQVAEHMDLLLESIFSYYRLGEADAANEEHAPLPDVVASVIDIFRSRLEEVGGEVVVGSLPPLSVSRGGMTRLFQNLVNNAVKFRGTEPLLIEISALDVADHWLFTFEDNGIGIDQDQVDRIFDMFTRLHSQERYPGSGVGLALCKRIVEQHGGKIWARSAPGKGTAIHFTLPKAEKPR